MRWRKGEWLWNNGKEKKKIRPSFTSSFFFYAFVDCNGTKDGKTIEDVWGNKDWMN